MFEALVMEVEHVVEVGGRVVLFEVALAEPLQEGLGDDPVVLLSRFYLHFYSCNTTPFETAINCITET